MLLLYLCVPNLNKASHKRNLWQLHHTGREVLQQWSLNQGLHDEDFEQMLQPGSIIGIAKVEDFHALKHAGKNFLPNLFVLGTIKYCAIHWSGVCKAN